jgi:hypothetical protein
MCPIMLGPSGTGRSGLVGLGSHVARGCQRRVVPVERDLDRDRTYDHYVIAHRREYLRRLPHQVISLHDLHQLIVSRLE